MPYSRATPRPVKYNGNKFSIISVSPPTYISFSATFICMNASASYSALSIPLGGMAASIVVPSIDSVVAAW